MCVWREAGEKCKLGCPILFKHYVERIPVPNTEASKRNQSKLRHHSISRLCRVFLQRDARKTAVSRRRPHTSRHSLLDTDPHLLLDPSGPKQWPQTTCAYWTPGMWLVWPEMCRKCKIHIKLWRLRTKKCKISQWFFMLITCWDDNI